MNQKSLPFDICAKKHRGNRNSVVANRKAQPFKQCARERIFALIADSGQRGMTLRELANAMNKFPHQISGRISELKIDRRIDQLGERDGFAVYVAETTRRK